MGRGFEIKYVLYLLSTLMVLGGGIGALLYYAFPVYFPHWYFGILTFIFVLECGVIHAVVKGSGKLSGRKMVNLYMGLKGVKIFLSVLFVGAYMLLVKEGAKSFVLVYLSFYMFYVLLELPFFAEVERRIKKEEG